MKKEQVVYELLNSANNNGVVATLYGVFGKSVNVRVPFSKKACETDIDEIDFSVRASNSMKRAGIFTVGDAIDLIADDGLLRIRNLGKKTQNEIKTRIMEFGYERLTTNEKKMFFLDVIERNCGVLSNERNDAFNQ